MTWPNQPVLAEAQIRFGSAGDPFRWYTSQPPKCGPVIDHFSRLPSEVSTNAPLRVPASTRTCVMPSTPSLVADVLLPDVFESGGRRAPWREVIAMPR